MPTLNRLFFALLLAALAGAATAQTAASAPRQVVAPAPASLQNKEQPKQAKSAETVQKVQRLRTEDEGSRIDETRVGGQMQSIEVQSKQGGTSYEVLPNDPLKGRAAGRDSGPGQAGPTVWNVLRF